MTLETIEAGFNPELLQNSSLNNSIEQMLDQKQMMP